MESSLAVSIKGVSKKYKLYLSSKERLVEAFHPFQKKFHKEFWALKNVSFDVEKGSTFGIVGRNGSGKSTLLQIICSVLRPTEGNVEVSGQVAALLELGAGFNPEFTGRDNVIFNGTLMGFSAKEMEQRMPEIESFAEIGTFIHQPVKTYSSGMFARLAFSAAIHVDPDILIVDEALSVGDAKFQHKCFQKFHEFQAQGKTIIFVSHDLNKILQHCNRALLLENGSILEMGKPKDVINQYIDLLEAGFDAKLTNPANNGSSSSSQDAESPKAVADQDALDHFLTQHTNGDNCPNRKNYNPSEYKQGSGRAEIIDYLVVSPGKCDPVAVHSGDWVEFYIKAKFNTSVTSALYGISINTVNAIQVYALNSFFVKAYTGTVDNNHIQIAKFRVPLKLAPGEYFIDLGIDEPVDAQQYQSLARRCSIIHLTVYKKNMFHGLADLEATFQMVLE